MDDIEEQLQHYFDDLQEEIRLLEFELMRMRMMDREDE